MSAIVQIGTTRLTSGDGAVLQASASSYLGNWTIPHYAILPDGRIRFAPGVFQESWINQQCLLSMGDITGEPVLYGRIRPKRVERTADYVEVRLSADILNRAIPYINATAQSLDDLAEEIARAQAVPYQFVDYLADSNVPTGTANIDKPFPVLNILSGILFESFWDLGYIVQNNAGVYSVQAKAFDRSPSVDNVKTFRDPLKWSIWHDPNPHGTACNRLVLARDGVTKTYEDTALATAEGVNEHGRLLLYISPSEMDQWAARYMARFSQQQIYIRATFQGAILIGEVFKAAFGQGILQLAPHRAGGGSGDNYQVRRAEYDLVRGTTEVTALRVWHDPANQAALVPVSTVSRFPPVPTFTVNGVERGVESVFASLTNYDASGGYYCVVEVRRADASRLSFGTVSGYGPAIPLDPLVWPRIAQQARAKYVNAGDGRESAWSAWSAEFRPAGPRKYQECYWLGTATRPNPRTTSTQRETEGYRPTVDGRIAVDEMPAPTPSLPVVWKFTRIWSPSARFATVWNVERIVSTYWSGQEQVAYRLSGVNSTPALTTTDAQRDDDDARPDGWVAQRPDTTASQRYLFKASRQRLPNSPYWDVWGLDGLVETYEGDRGFTWTSPVLARLTKDVLVRADSALVLPSVTGGGTSPYTYSLEGTNAALIPTGMQFNTAAGGATLSGTPTAAGAFTFELTATDSATPSLTDSTTVTLYVDAAAVTLAWVEPLGTTALLATAGNQTLSPASPTLPRATTSRSGATVSYSTQGLPDWLSVDSKRVVSADANPPAGGGRIETFRWVATDGTDTIEIAIGVQVQPAYRLVQTNPLASSFSLESADAGGGDAAVSGQSAYALASGSVRSGGGGTVQDATAGGSVRSGGGVSQGNTAYGGGGSASGSVPRVSTGGALWDSQAGGPGHHHSVPARSFSVTLPSHRHGFSLSNHTHGFNGARHTHGFSGSHTHSFSAVSHRHAQGSFSASLRSHKHGLPIRIADAA